MQNCFSSTYKYYTKYIIFSFLLSAYSYTTIMRIPTITHLNVICKLFYVNRKFTFLKQFFFLFLVFFKLPKFGSRILTSTGKEWHLQFFYNKQSMFLFYEKYLFLIFPQLKRSPIVADFNANDTFTFFLRGFIAPEEKILFKNRLEEHILGNIELAWFFTPKKKTFIYEQRNLLRLINVPLLWKT